MSADDQQGVTDRPATGRDDRPRLMVAVGATVVVVAVAMALLTVPLFLRPASDDPTSILAEGPLDAVVVLGGGFGERIGVGRDLADLQVAAGMEAPTVVLMTGFPPPIQTCGYLPRSPDLPLECLRPDPFTTSGEALIIGQRGTQDWDRVAVVTSDYHLTRSRLLVDRCVAALAPDMRVAYVDAQPAVSVLRRAWVIAQEWISLAGTPSDHVPECR